MRSFEEKILQPTVSNVTPAAAIQGDSGQRPAERNRGSCQSEKGSLAATEI